MSIAFIWSFRFFRKKNGCPYYHIVESVDKRHKFKSLCSSKFANDYPTCVDLRYSVQALTIPINTAVM